MGLIWNLNATGRVLILFFAFANVRYGPILFFDIFSNVQKNYPRNRLKLFQYLERKLEFEEALLIIITKNRRII